MENQLLKSTLYPCSQCGKQYSNGKMLEFEGLFICFNCKPVFIQKLKEGIPISTTASRSKWWKIYFFIALAVSLLGFTLSVKDLLSGERLIGSISGLVVYPWMLVAIFGYAFNKRIMVRRVWKALFPVAIITDIITAILVYMSSTDQYSSEHPLLIFVVTYVIASPLIYFQYVALYRYGFSKTEPWEEQVHNND